jgi:hypothetical protein
MLQQLDVPTVTLVKPMPRFSPAVPVKVTRPFCPARPNDTLVELPPEATVAVTSSESVSVAEPVAVPDGSTTIVYVPVVGSVGKLIAPPSVPSQL